MSYGKNCECSSCRNDGIDEETKTVILKDGTKAKYCIECIKESLEIKVNIHCQKCEHDIMDKETNSDILRNANVLVATSI